MGNDIKLDLGSVKIHKHVIEGLVAKTLEGVSGVQLIQPKWLDRLSSIFSSPSRPGINVRVDENQEIVLDLSVNVAYGSNIPATARLIQDVVKQDIKKALDLGIKDVNVDIEAVV
jgi:uncharacterized alkaline shock family protein YloU